jgi:hypothetical protein
MGPSAPRLHCKIGWIEADFPKTRKDRDYGNRKCERLPRADLAMTLDLYTLPSSWQAHLPVRRQPDLLIGFEQPQFYRGQSGTI